MNKKLREFVLLTLAKRAAAGDMAAARLFLKESSEADITEPDFSALKAAFALLEGNKPG